MGLTQRALKAWSEKKARDNAATLKSIDAARKHLTEVWKLPPDSFQIDVAACAKDYVVFTHEGLRFRMVRGASWHLSVWAKWRGREMDWSGVEDWETLGRLLSGEVEDLRVVRE